MGGGLCPLVADHLTPSGFLKYNLFIELYLYVNMLFYCMFMLIISGNNDKCVRFQANKMRCGYS